jgi:phospholipid/cholesterol/gamma-HCH transport system ATP-binding protein
MRSKFGMLFQGAALLQWLSVFDNVALPLRQRTKLSEEEIKQRVEERLEWVGLGETALQLPATLSGGMQKRVGLARATIMNPECILYDEPTSGLDPLTSRKMDQLICTINQQMHTTSVVVTHDMISALAIGTRILMLHEGQVVACDTPNEFVKCDVEIVQQFLKAQQINERRLGEE